MVLSAVPSVGAVLGIVGFTLVLVAIKNISDVVADKSIFNKMLVAVGLGIAGIVVGALVVVGSVLRFVGLNGLSLGPDFNPSTVPTGDWVGLIGSVLVGLAVVWIMLVVSAVYVRRSYGSIASRQNVGMFGTAGLLSHRSSDNDNPRRFPHPVRCRDIDNRRFLLDRGLRD